jgi:serine/threonine protein kinase
MENYKLEDVLGEGGFGKVIKAIRKDSNEVFALKIIDHNSPNGYT